MLFRIIAFTFLLASWATFARADAQPNFIFMLSDDQSWAGLSVRMDPDNPHSQSLFDETPHLEKLANQGMRFSNAYAPSPVCSPTRISIQTGRTPAALNWTKASPILTARDGKVLIPPHHSRSIETDEITIGEILRADGYATAHLGKWHLSGGGPEQHGYDVSDGDTGNQHAAMFKDPNPVDLFGMATRAEQFMKNAKDMGKPFYLQLSFHALHAPQNALQSSLEHFSQKLGRGTNNRAVARAAITKDMDTSIGRILNAVKKLGLEKTTFVIFMSDNGAGGRNGMLSGGKGGLFEGGIRVPFIVRGPNIQANSVNQTPIIGYDLLPTLVSLAGITELPSTIEGADISPLFLNVEAKVERNAGGLVFHFPHYQNDTTPQSAFITEGWKIIKYYDGTPTKLFNLTLDSAEQRDLSQARENKAIEMEKLLLEYLENVGAAFPTPNV